MKSYFCGPQSLVRRQLWAWLASSPGRQLLAAERQRIDAILTDLFGYHLVQIGEVPGGDLLSCSRIPHHVAVTLGDEPTANGLSLMRASAEALPFQSDSIDVVVLPHTLDFEPNPHQVLREAERILIPEGYLVLTGFNPFSLWGLWRLLRARSGTMPWCGNFLGITRLRDWLSLLGFDLEKTHGLFFRPPLRSERLLDRLHWLETLGARGWPVLGGAYCLVARKHVVTLTPIRPRWSTGRLVSPRLVEPTTRQLGRRGTK